MTYKESLTAAMTELARDPACVFLGYGITHGRAMGTLRDVPASQLIETPVAENLMVGLAIGLSLKGRKPVVFFERFDFVLNAADAIVNHLNAAATISRGEFKPAVILRVVVGNKTKPLFTGETHVQDYTMAFRSMVSFPVMCVRNPEEVAARYKLAEANQANGVSTMLVEYKDNL